MLITNIYVFGIWEPIHSSKFEPKSFKMNFQGMAFIKKNLSSKYTATPVENRALCTEFMKIHSNFSPKLVVIDKFCLVHGDFYDKNDWIKGKILASNKNWKILLSKIRRNVQSFCPDFSKILNIKKTKHGIIKIFLRIMVIRAFQKESLKKL